MNKYMLLILLSLTAFISSCKKDNSTECNYYTINRLGDYSLETDVATDQVSMLFQVLDRDEKGVVGLNNKSLYEVLDFESDVTQSPEADVQIDTFGAIPVTVYSVLVLDLSKSVEGLVPQIKQSANAFINSSLSQQKIAIYTFDGDAPKRRIGYTNNRAQLLAAVNSLPETGLGSSTNLYDAITEAVDYLPNEQYTTSGIVQCNVLLFTDGKEEAKPQNQSAAIYAVSGYNVFVAALQSPSLDESTLKSLAGSESNYFKASSIGDLETRFKEIQQDIIKLSKSVYWLYYTSPRRGSTTWNLKVKLKENCNDIGSNYAEGTYSSSGF